MMSLQSGSVLSPLPRWLLPAGAVMSVIGGIINTICLLSFVRQPVTHVTGSVSSFAAAIAVGDSAALLRFAAVLGAFFAGAMAGGAIARERTLALGRRYGVGMLAQAVALAAAAPLLDAHNILGVCLAAFAASLQNALASTFSGALVRTSHLTGMVTDLGIYLAHALLRLPIVRLRVRISVTIVFGFLFGSLLGAVGLRYLGNGMLYVLAVPIGVAAIGYIAVRTVRRNDGGAAQSPA
jgi:uncharacterized membrane protein YoaK (UPF0700 family)